MEDIIELCIVIVASCCAALAFTFTGFIIYELVTGGIQLGTS